MPPRPKIKEALDDQGVITGSLANGDSTDDTTPTLTGTAEANSTVTIRDGDTVLGSVEADGNGNWSFTPTDPLGEGSHSLTVTTTDPAGNTSEPSDAFELNVDISAPDAPDINPTDGSVISGTAEPGSTIELDVDGDGTSDLTTTADETTGDWSVAPDSPLADDTVVTVTATDPAGNTSPQATTTVDTQPPVAPTIAEVADDEGDVTGALANGDSTDDTTPTLTGTAEAGSTVTILDGGTVLGSVDADGNGSWSFTPTDPLGEGSHSLTVTATDPAGNTSEPSAAFELNVDISAPDAPDINPTDGSVISGTAEPGSTIELDVDGDGTSDLTTTADETTGDWSVAPDSPLADDTVITVTAMDPAGNTSPQATTTVDTSLDDTQPPVAPTIAEVVDDEGDVTGALANGDSTDDATPTLSGTAEAGSTVTILDGDTVLGTAVADDSGHWSYTPISDLGEGSHSLTATATDDADNTSEPSDAFELNVDISAPDAPVINPTDGSVISGTAEPGSTIELDVDGDGTSDLTTTADETTGDWSVAPDSPLADDTVVTVTATDPAGNTSPQATTTVDTSLNDTQPPVAPTIAEVADDEGDVTGALANGDSTDDTTPALSGTAEAGSTVTIFDGDTVLGTAVADDSGHWSYTPVSDLGEGSHSLTATATDDADNTSEPSAAFELIVDTTSPGGDDGTDAPTLAIAEAADDDTVNADELSDGVEASVGLTDGTQAGDTITLRITDADNVTTEVPYTVTADDIANDSATVVIPSDTLADGDYSVEAVISDAAGNSSAVSNSIAFSVDATSPGGDAGTDAPTLTIAEAADGINASELADGVQAEVGLTPGTEAGDTITLRITDADNVTSEVSYTVTADDVTNDSAPMVIPSDALTDGDYSVTAVISDAAGNSSEVSPEVEFRVDTAAPEVPSITTASDDVGDVTDTLASGDSTDDTTPTLSGTAVAGNTVTIRDGDSVLGTAVADDSGHWSYTPVSDLGEGSHSFTATATDAAGNTSGPSDAFELIVDTTSPGGADGTDAPTLTIAEAADGAINASELADGVETRVELTDGTQAGDTITLRITDADNVTSEVSYTVTADDVANDSAPVVIPSDALTDGSYSVTAAISDAAGNSSAVSPEVEFRVDTAAPEAPSITTASDDVGDVTDPLASGDSTDDTTPTLSGTAEADSTVTILDGDTVLGSVEVDGSGDWTFTPTGPLAEGDYRFTATATDAAGNTSDPSTAFELSVDTTSPGGDDGTDAPTLAIAEAADDDTVNADELSDGVEASVGLTDGTQAGDTITLRITDANDVTTEVPYTVTADDVTDGSATVVIPSDALEDGSYSVEAVITDAADNGSAASPSVDFGVDAAAPEAPTIGQVQDDAGDISGALTSGDSTDDTTPTLSGTAEAGSTVTILDGGTVLDSVEADGSGNWSFTPTDPLGEGSHSLTVTATDPAGNTSEPSAAFELNVDISAPDAPDINPTDGSVISGTAEPGSTIELDVDGDGTSDLTTTADETTGDWSVAPDSPLADDTVITVTATDPAGNTSPQATTTVDTSLNDTQPPVAPTIAEVVDDEGDVTGALANGDSTDDTTPALSGTAEAGSTVTILDGDTVLGTAVADDSGHWSYTPVSDLGEGSHSLTATATDDADNTSEPSDAFELIVDTTSPGGTDGMDAPTLAIAEAADGFVNVDELADGVQAEVGLTPGTEVGDTITLRITDADNVTTEAPYTVTADDIANDSAPVVIPSDALTDGSYSVTAAISDAAGNSSAVSPEVEFRVDTAAPEVPSITTASDDVGEVTDPLASGDSTDDTTPTLSGTAEADSMVTILGGDTVLGSVEADSSGDWTFTPTVPLADGDYSFTATATDAAGNTSDPSTAFELSVDTTSPGGDDGTDAPTLAIAEAADDDTVNADELSDGVEASVGLT
ncbi:Ig-like domain-containing protein, partial [Halomonas sp. PAR8]|uniref:Ig-like domain-containing protein n=2 Tax=unclassified Halomonas TaxID=2609666 RepID=UPI002884C1E8